jgi:hypothetical protein
MRTLVISEKQGDILLPLPVLLQRLSFLPVVLWGFRELTIRYPKPFGLSVAEFERLTRDLASGFLVSNHDFQMFLKADFQVIDGYVDAYTVESLQSPSFYLECVDTTQWQISIASDAIVEELERRGFGQ